MQIFLTGATGFLGKNFLNLALKNKYKIFALTRKKKKLKKNKNLIWLHGSLEDNWFKELKRSKILVHFAAAGVADDDPVKTYDTNIFKSQNLLETAIKAKCKRWVIISSSAEYGNSNKKKYFSKTTNRLPNTNYGLSKAIFSDVCADLSFKNNCKARIMKLFFVYGRGENKKRLYPSLIHSINKKKNFYLKNPYETRDFSNVNFVSKSILDALKFEKNKFKNSQIWHISEGKQKLIKDFAMSVIRNKKSSINLIYKKQKKTFNHISDKKSLWKI